MKYSFSQPTTDDASCSAALTAKSEMTENLFSVDADKLFVDRYCDAVAKRALKIGELDWNIGGNS